MTVLEKSMVSGQAWMTEGVTHFNLKSDLNSCILYNKIRL
jgi:hypothetical protein